MHATMHVSQNSEHPGAARPSMHASGRARARCRVRRKLRGNTGTPRTSRSTSVSTIVMSILTVLTLLAPAAPMPPAPATLWTSGQGFPCYRQPVIVSAGGSRLLAFVEGRFSSPCAPAAPLGAEANHPNEVGGLNLRISEDLGQSWGPTKIIYGNAVSCSDAQFHQDGQSC